MKSAPAAIKYWFPILIAVGLALHVLGMTQPFLGNFAQHQTDYATVVQRWLANGSIEPFNPVMRFMAHGQNRLFFGDFPLNITLSAFVSKLFHIPIEISGRGLSALFFILSIFPFYKLCRRKLADSESTVYCTLFYLFSPLTIIYGQAFLLEVTALSFGVIGYYYYFTWRDTKAPAQLIASGLSCSLMLASRIYYAPALIPLGLLHFKNRKLTALKQWEIWAWCAISVALPLLWQKFASSAAAAHGDESSLSDNLKVFVFSDPVLRAKLLSFDFYLPAIKTIAFKIVTPIGLALALIHIWQNKNSALTKFALLFCACFTPLLLLAPRKFTEFEYYFLPFVPIFSILAGVELSRLKSQKLSAILIAVVLISGLRLSWNPTHTVPEEDKNVLSISRQAEELIPKNSKALAAHGSSTSLLYYLNRDGWAFELPDQIDAVRNLQDVKGTAIERLERFRGQGAEYFVIANTQDLGTNPEFATHIKTRYQVIHESDIGLIIQLKPKNP